MATIKRIGPIAAAAALFLAFVTPAMAASDITVGDFVQRLAAAKGLAGTDTRVAVDALRGIGVRVPADLNYSKKLTEGDVAIMARSFGLNVTTTNPDNLFTSDQVDSFFATFGGDIDFTLVGDDGLTSKHHAPGLTFDPYSKGKGGSKGKKKGHDFTPTEPE